MLQPNEAEAKEIQQIGRQYSHFLAYLMRVRSKEFETVVLANDHTAVAQGRARLADDFVKLFTQLLAQK